jgi:sigma-B regulation protein RsbU (phosphoserine phosphatase)
MNILIAEDDLISRKLLQTNLEQMGYQVTASTDGQEAWDIYDRVPYPIVVSDWLMPSVNGLELCKKIRQRPDTEYTYFILLTANVGEEKNYFEAMESGVDDFLSKPLDRQQLAIRLRVAKRILKDTSRIKSLENIVTMCAYTKKIKMEEESWQNIEEFIEKYLGIKLSHGIHPDYYEQVIVPEIEKLKRDSAAD